MSEYVRGGRAINYKELRLMRKSLGEQKTYQHLSRMLEEEVLRPRDFSIRELAEALVPDGREWVQNYLNPRTSRQKFLEATEVKSSLFTNITGQIVFSEIKERYEDEEFVFSKAIESVQSNFLDMEKIPGFGRIGDEAEVIDEGQPYPIVGISEDYIEIGPKKKRGKICPITREAIFSDRTGQILDFVGEVGYWLGLNGEKRVIDAIIDENTGAASAVAGGHRYHWKGTSYASYQTSTPWDNVTASAGLTDWTDINEAWQTLAAITDPYTGEPIMIQPDTLIVTPDLLFTAKRIVSATEVRSGDITTGAGNQTLSANPVNMVLQNLTVLCSRLLKARMATDTTWYLGNPRKAVKRYYNWDLETDQAPSNNPDEFDRDIAMKFKAGVRDIVSVVEPRVMNKSTA